jgi:hypothetical protein
MLIDITSDISVIIIQLVSQLKACYDVQQKTIQIIKDMVGHQLHPLAAL